MVQVAVHSAMFLSIGSTQATLRISVCRKLVSHKHREAKPFSVSLGRRPLSDCDLPSLRRALFMQADAGASLTCRNSATPIRDETTPDQVLRSQLNVKQKLKPTCPNHMMKNMQCVLKLLVQHARACRWFVLEAMSKQCHTIAVYYIAYSPSRLQLNATGLSRETLNYFEKTCTNPLLLKVQ